MEHRDARDVCVADYLARVSGAGVGLRGGGKEAGAESWGFLDITPSFRDA